MVARLAAFQCKFRIEPWWTIVKRSLEVWIAIIALSVITVNVSEWSEGDQRGSRLSGISSETFRFGEIWEDV